MTESESLGPNGTHPAPGGSWRPEHMPQPAPGGGFGDDATQPMEAVSAAPPARWPGGETPSTLRRYDPRTWKRGWQVGCGAAAIVGTLIFCGGSTYALTRIIQPIGGYSEETRIPTPHGAAGQPQSTETPGAVCGPAQNDRGHTVTDGRNDGTFFIKSAGGPTMVDVTQHDGNEFEVEVVVLQPGESATFHNVFGEHAWAFGPGCTLSGVDAQVADHVNSLNNLPNTQAQSVPESDLENQGILTVDASGNIQQTVAGLGQQSRIPTLDLRSVAKVSDRIAQRREARLTAQAPFWRRMLPAF